jgi:hypothetical protein
MRGIGMFFGRATRADPVKLEDPRPLTDYGTHDLESGNAGLDGYTVLSKASPTAQGSPPPVAGAIGPAYQGPDSSFEQ